MYPFAALYACFPSMLLEIYLYTKSSPFVPSCLIVSHHPDNVYICVHVQSHRRGKIESQLKAKKQEAAKWSREVSLLEKKVREQEVEMSKRKPLYIKAKEKTSHVLKRLEASKYICYTC